MAGPVAEIAAADFFVGFQRDLHTILKQHSIRTTSFVQVAVTVVAVAVACGAIFGPIFILRLVIRIAARLRNRVRLSLVSRKIFVVIFAFGRLRVGVIVECLIGFVNLELMSVATLQASKANFTCYTYCDEFSIVTTLVWVRLEYSLFECFADSIRGSARREAESCIVRLHSDVYLFGFSW